jgi:hypothetical protein
MDTNVANKSSILPFKRLKEKFGQNDMNLVQSTIAKCAKARSVLSQKRYRDL